MDNKEDFLEGFTSLDVKSARKSIQITKNQLRDNGDKWHIVKFASLMDKYPQEDEEQIFKEARANVIIYATKTLDIFALQTAIDWIQDEPKKDTIKEKIVNEILDNMDGVIQGLLVQYKTSRGFLKHIDSLIEMYEHVAEILDSTNILDKANALTQEIAEVLQTSKKNPFYIDLEEVQDTPYSSNKTIDSEYKKKAINELLGMCRMLSMGNINKEQILFLEEWLEKNNNLEFEYPFDKVVEEIRRVLGDNEIDDKERIELKEFFEKVAGVKLSGAPKNQNKTIELLPFVTPEIDFSNKLFCLTGDFQTISREKATEFIESKGGIVKKGITLKTDYLIVGLMASDAYKYGNFGSKIEYAIKNNKSGKAKPAIISEDWLIRFL